MIAANYYIQSFRICIIGIQCYKTAAIAAVVPLLPTCLRPLVYTHCAQCVFLSYLLYTGTLGRLQLR